MSQASIIVENISKLYRLGDVGRGTIKDDLNRFWHRIRGKEDPFLKVGQANDRTKKEKMDFVWALKNINFEVSKGEVVGIIGKNGAGKSTLLKIITKITSPTTGEIKTKGRVASLLEVGTGFHPDLTGRENVFMNGAILGMRKWEIQKKFDEIVDFAGVSAYIDTPVKRYSSGMVVRLGFAVAAHLEPEILIVDEVLAVGDAEFQKKCIGKMKEVSNNQGRTVLFVSHNMTAVENLCTRAVYLNNGEIAAEGITSDIIKRHIEKDFYNNRFVVSESLDSSIGNDAIKLIYAGVENGSADNIQDTIDVSNKILLRFKVINLTNAEIISIGFEIKTAKGDILFGSGEKFECIKGKSAEVLCTIPSDFLNNDTYQINAFFHDDNMKSLLQCWDLLTFEVKDNIRDSGYAGKINGLIRPKLNWIRQNNFE